MRWLIAILVVGLSTAHAAPGDGVVVESYSGQRPTDANRLLSPVLDELANRGYVAGPEVVGRRFEQRVSRPSLVENGLSPLFDAIVDQGHKAWIAGRFDEAVKILTPLVDSAHANPGAFAQNEPMRKKLLKAMIALALSYQRIGDNDATRATFGEILRSFPDTQLERAAYGPDAFNLFEDVRKQTQAGGKGTLAIKATNEVGVIFINERFASASGSVKEKVIPGEYRVFVQVGKQLSRMHRVNVTANNSEEPIVIDTEFDALVNSSPGWTGFVFPDGAAREKNESLYAAAFANAVNARGVVVIGIDTIRGKRAIFGALVSLMNGSEVRRAYLNLDPDPSADRLRALARFVAGDNAAPEYLEVVKAGDLKAEPRSDGKGVQIGDIGERRGGRQIWGGWKWLTGGAGLGALGVGAYLLSIDGDCTDDVCTYQRETSVPGWLTLSGGAVLTGVSIYLFVRGSGESSLSRSAYIVPTHGGAYAGYALSF